MTYTMITYMFGYNVWSPADRLSWLEIHTYLKRIKHSKY